MTRVRTTYQIEERYAGLPPEKWARGSVSQTDVLALFTTLVADDAASDAPVFGPHTGHRLVLLAVPASSAPLNSDAQADLDAVLCRHCETPIELVDGGRRWRHLHTGTLTGTRHLTCGLGAERGTTAEPAAVTR
jgi:hypothetical protein